MKARTGRGRARPAVEKYVAADGQPHHHEHPLGIGDTFFAFGDVHRIVGMVGLGMPVREITLQVEPARGADHGGGG